MNENSLLERVSAAAEERQLSQNTLTAYRRTWLKAIAWAAAEGLALETLPSGRLWIAARILVKNPADLFVSRYYAPV